MALPAGQSPTARISLAPMILPAASCTCSTSCGQKYSRPPLSLRAGGVGVGAVDFARRVVHLLHILWPEVFPAAVVVAAAVDVVEHHALREQPVERLIDLD